MMNTTVSVAAAYPAPPARVCDPTLRGDRLYRVIAPLDGTTRARGGENV